MTDEEKIKLFENTVEQIFGTEIPVDGNLAKEREKIEESYKNEFSEGQTCPEISKSPKNIWKGEMT